MADLVRQMQPVPEGLQLDFLRASSYHATSTTSSGHVDVSMGTKSSVRGRHVILCEDIVDTGRTLQRISQLLLERGAASVKCVALLDKACRRQVQASAEYVGFECPDSFVVGYGLDFNEHYRSLPYIGVLKPECYQ